MHIMQIEKFHLIVLPLWVIFRWISQIILEISFSLIQCFAYLGFVREEKDVLYSIIEYANTLLLMQSKTFVRRVFINQFNAQLTEESSSWFKQSHMKMNQ